MNTGIYLNNVAIVAAWVELLVAFIPKSINKTIGSSSIETITNATKKKSKLTITTCPFLFEVSASILIT